MKIESRSKITVFIPKIYGARSLARSDDANGRVNLLCDVNLQHHSLLDGLFF